MAHEMRTAPPWGARIRTSFLHDGRAWAVRDAILARDSQGVAVLNLFACKSRAPEQAQLLEFINSLSAEALPAPPALEDPTTLEPSATRENM